MKTKTKKILSRIGIVLLALVVVILAVRAVLNYATGKKLEAAIAAQVDKGRRLSLQSFEPLCKDEDNAALIWKGIEPMFLEDFNTRTVLNQPLEDLYYGRSLSGESKKAIEAVALKNQNIFQLLREAAGKSCFKYNTRWNIAVFDLKLPSLVKLLKCLRLFFLNALLQAERGNMDQALNDCEAGIRFVSLFLREPFVINRLGAMAVLRSEFLVLNAIMAKQNIHPERMSTILGLLDSIPLRETFAAAYNSEIAFSLGVTMSLMKGDARVISSHPTILDKAYVWLLRPILKSECLYSLELWDIMEPAIRLPYYESKEAQKRFAEKRKKAPRLYTEIGYLFPELDILLVKENDREAGVAVARVGLASEIFRIQNGRWPETLDQLAPGLLKEIPVDPFTGKPLIYRKSETGFIVYSVGPNEKNDEGRGTWMPGQLVLEKDDDIAWKK